jgi:hypothetical protein
MSFVSTFDHTNPMADKNPNLEMLMQREQLMEDIDCIITDYFQGVDDDELNEVTRILCDAVCKNFPTN